MTVTVRIIGTSHISRQSVEEITAAFNEMQPDIVAVELDRQRLKSLQEFSQGARPGIPPLSLARKVGITGWLFMVVGGWAQRKLAGVVKVLPGVDMLTAVTLARENDRRMALIDRDVVITMKRLGRLFTFREKLRMVRDIVLWPLHRKRWAFPLDKVPSRKLIGEMMGFMRERYPGLYRALITERNAFMAARIDALVRENPGSHILVVVGAGHEDDLRDLLGNVGHLADVC